MRPHNLPFVLLGVGLLWFGWFGFNAGSGTGRQRHGRGRVPQHARRGLSRHAGLACGRADPRRPADHLRCRLGRRRGPGGDHAVLRNGQHARRRRGRAGGGHRVLVRHRAEVPLRLRRLARRGRRALRRWGGRRPADRAAGHRGHDAAAPRGLLYGGGFAQLGKQVLAAVVVAALRVRRVVRDRQGHRPADGLPRSAPRTRPPASTSPSTRRPPMPKACTATRPRAARPRSAVPTRPRRGATRQTRTEAARSCSRSAGRPIWRCSSSWARPSRTAATISSSARRRIRDFHWGNCISSPIPRPSTMRTGGCGPSAGVAGAGLDRDRTRADARGHRAWARHGLELELDDVLADDDVAAADARPSGTTSAGSSGTTGSSSSRGRSSDNEATASTSAVVARAVRRGPVPDAQRALASTAAPRRSSAPSSTAGWSPSWVIVDCGGTARYQTVGTAPEHRGRGLRRTSSGWPHAWAASTRLRAVGHRHRGRRTPRAGVPQQRVRTRRARACRPTAPAVRASFVKIDEGDDRLRRRADLRRSPWPTDPACARAC